MTPFPILLQLSGLSHQEAANFLVVRPDTVKSWSSGRRTVPQGAVDKLCGLIAAQDRAAGEAIAQIAELTEPIAAHGAPESVEIGYPADDYEASHLGFPTVSTWAAMAARVIVSANVKIILVPRGSTPATAAAADAHRK